MIYRLEIRHAAKREFDDAIDWYNAEDPLLGDKFIFAIEKTLYDLTRSPNRFPIVFGSSVRRATVQRFPYSIFFVVKTELVVVISIFNDSRNPIIWRGRID